jgi:hypothetical protein
MTQPQDKKSRLLKLLERAKNLSVEDATLGGANFVYHAAWLGLLGFTFIEPSFLSNPLAAVVFGGLGGEVLGDFLSKIVNEPDDKKFKTELKELIAKAHIKEAFRGHRHSD